MSNASPARPVQLQLDRRQQRRQQHRQQRQQQRRQQRRRSSKCIRRPNCQVHWPTKGEEWAHPIEW